MCAKKNTSGSQIPIAPRNLERASVLLGLGGGGVGTKMFANVFADALAEAFALFGGHAAAAVVPLMTETVAAGTVPSKSAEKDAAKREKSNGLPERYFAPAEERRQKPVPEVQDDLAAGEDEEQHRENRQRNNEKHF